MEFACRLSKIGCASDEGSGGFSVLHGLRSSRTTSKQIYTRVNIGCLQFACEAKCSIEFGTGTLIPEIDQFKELGLERKGKMNTIMYILRVCGEGKIQRLIKVLFLCVFVF